MTETVTVEIPLDLAKDFVKRQDFTGKLEKLVKEALPPEYPDGTIAWVTTPWSKYLLFRENGHWAIRKGGEIYVSDKDVQKVEVLTVAKRGEIVVRRPDVSSGGLENAAEALARDYYHSTAHWLRDVAEAVRNA